MVEIVRWSGCDDDVLTDLVNQILIMRQEGDPQTHPGHAEDLRASLLRGFSGFHSAYHVAYRDGAACGHGDCQYAVSSSDSSVGNDDAAWVSTYVLPSYRRQSVGSALLRAVIDDLPSERTRLWAEIPGRGDFDQSHPGVLFARHHGFHLTDVERERRLSLPVDEKVLSACDTAVDGRVGEYEIHVFVDGVDEEYLDSALEIFGAVEQEAPTGDRDVEAVNRTTDDYAAELAQDLQSGCHQVTSLAVLRSGDGVEVVAFSGVDVPKNPQRNITVNGTLVRREHRGHGLGMAVKVAVLRACSQFPHRVMSTENSLANGPMVHINERLGFVEYGWLAQFDAKR